MSELIALLNGKLIGAVEQGSRGSLTFTYDETWRDEVASYPLSLSMPLARKTHADVTVRAYLEGLLPDNRRLLEQWGRNFAVSPQNPFALLTHMGEDCAGAIQLVTPERLDAIVEFRGEVEWLSEDKVADLLRDLVERHGTGRSANNQGQFSLAGAQPKTALFHDDRGWGIPSGSIPTTHILKPSAHQNLDGFEINEHFCLTLAGRLGSKAAASEVQHFEGQPAIVVARYDRVWSEDGRVVRVHQEDVCQALGVPPWTKYENEGGPGAADIISLLLRESDDPGADVGTFVDSLVLNWAIAGSDAHAKNYSLLLRPGSVSLAPLYDVLTVLPYRGEFSYRQVKLAMRVYREYLVWKVMRRDWERLALRCDLDPEPLVDRAIELLSAIPEAAHQTARKLKEEGLVELPVDHLQESISEHSIRCLRRLQPD